MHSIRQKRFGEMERHAGGNLRLHRHRRGLGRLRGGGASVGVGALPRAAARGRPARQLSLDPRAASATTSSTRTEGCNWKFESEPVAGLNGRTSYQPRGKMLGGTSSINGMVYMRGTSADYDGWRQRGCEGWDYASVLPYFRKAEDQERGENEFHGVGGPLQGDGQPLQERDRRRHHGGGRAGRHPAQSRLQRRDPGWGRLLPDDRRQRPALERGGGLPAARTQPQEPGRRHRCACHAHADRGQARSRRRVPHADRARAGAGTRRGYRLGRRLRLAATPAAVRRRARRSTCRTWASPWCTTCRRSAPTCTIISTRMSPGAARRPITLNDFAMQPDAQGHGGHAYVAVPLRPAVAATASLAGVLVTRTDPRLERPDLQINIFDWSTLERRDGTGIYPAPVPGLHDLSPCTCGPRVAARVRLKSPDPLAPPAIAVQLSRARDTTSRRCSSACVSRARSRATGAASPISPRRCSRAPP